MKKKIRRGLLLGTLLLCPPVGIVLTGIELNNEEKKRHDIEDECMSTLESVQDNLSFIYNRDEAHYKFCSNDVNNTIEYLKKNSQK